MSLVLETCVSELSRMRLAEYTKSSATTSAPYSSMSAVIHLTPLRRWNTVVVSSLTSQDSASTGTTAFPAFRQTGLKDTVIVVFHQRVDEIGAQISTGFIHVVQRRPIAAVYVVIDLFGGFGLIGFGKRGDARNQQSCRQQRCDQFLPPFPALNQEKMNDSRILNSLLRRNIP